MKNVALKKTLGGEPFVYARTHRQVLLSPSSQQICNYLFDNFLDVVLHSFHLSKLDCAMFNLHGSNSCFDVENFSKLAFTRTNELGQFIPLLVHL